MFLLSLMGVIDNKGMCLRPGLVLTGNLSIVP